MHITTLFRYISVLEGVSLLVLLGIAMPLKYIFELPMMVKIVGMFHGVLFVAYVLFALLFTKRAKWTFLELTWIVLLSVIPFGTFYADAKYLKRL
jgi:integral membrane protein